MTSPRRITCCILSAFAIASCGAANKDAPLRTVRVQALADPALREKNPRWDEEVRGLIEASSDYFDKEFGIRFVVQGTGPWPAEERVSSTAGLMVRMKKEFPLDAKKEPYDLLIAFTGERVNIYNGGRGRVDRIGDCRDGLGNYVVLFVSAPFRYTGANTEPTLDVIALIHELGHIFGAEHVQDSQSIMNENFDYRSEFDMKNRSVILKNRLCPFAAGEKRKE